jgi:2-C-methyl-D-erythritol 4-phosphate cytidylyltransferase
MKKYAIIVAGGTGNRMKGEVPKQFMLLNGKPVILYSIEAFYAFDPLGQIILVIHPDYLALWKTLTLEHKISIPFRVVEGGGTRFDSVKNGLKLIEEDGLVAVHDAARPVINSRFIGDLFAEASTSGSAIPVVPLNDTIRVIDGDASHQLDRTFLRSVQTPQVFRVSELQRAYTQPYQTGFTDDGSVMEASGFRIHLAAGNQGNIKITHLQDISVAEVLIKSLTTEERRT